MSHRRVLIGAAIVVSAALPFACGDTGGSGAAGTTASASSSVSASSSGSSSVASSSSGTLTCDASKFPGACGTCLQDHCCKELAEADAMMGLTQALGTCIMTSCSVCIPDPIPGTPACTAPAVAPSNGACVTLGNGIDCNPVTNAGCSNGEVCDYAQWGYTCYPGSNVEPLCGGCGMSNMFCSAGLTCANTTAGPAACFRYCCTDADCGGGTCVTNVLYFASGLGLCADTTTTSSTSTSTSSTTSTSSGAGGAGGAGGGGAGGAGGATTSSAAGTSTGTGA